MPADYYEILGVSHDAGEEEIKKAYRRLVRQHHPDANDGDPEAEARFKEVQLAYETLRDPQRRRQYDMFGPEGPEGPGSGGSGGSAGSEFGLNDLFDAFFGGEAFGGSRGGPPRGPDAETVLDLSLEEAVRGVTRVVDVELPIACETCDGSGCAPGTHPERCGNCQGSGAVRQVRRSLLGQLVTAGPCPTCSSTGSVIPSPCDACRGAGRVHGSRHLEVEVPAGIDEGQRLRLAGRGPAAPRGGVPGDLYVGIRVVPHPDFRRHGDDLQRVLRVAVTQAALGAKLVFDTFDGPEELVLPAGTQHGKVFTLRGRGVPSLRNGRRGDLLVEIAVEVPTRLSAEEAELLARLAAMRGEEVAPNPPGFISRIRSAFQ